MTRFSGNICKYKLGQTIGEGTFAKVKRAKNIVNGNQVAIKIIDKTMIIQNNLIYQVQREISNMKLLNHPNIVKIHEVLGSKTKIYIVMEYVPGGSLYDKLAYSAQLSEQEARKLFQQLIDAVEYCHCRGVCHRDLKPQNLLLDSQGNLKVSDFGLSALSKPGNLLETACGSPCYVAPELIRNQGYEGAAADIWACGVVLFEALSGYLPFNEHNISNLYKKILEADYRFPEWFTTGQKRLISRIFEADSTKRIAIPEIIADEWFQKNYEAAVGAEYVQGSEMDNDKESAKGKAVSEQSGFINAFQLIAMSQELDLSGLFEEKGTGKQRIVLGSKHTVTETIERIETAARDSCFLVERKNNNKIRILPQLTPKTCRPCVNLSAEVIEVAPTDCVVELSKSTGELQIYEEFCKSLSCMLGGPSHPSKRHMSHNDSIIGILEHSERGKVDGGRDVNASLDMWRHQTDTVACTSENMPESRPWWLIHVFRRHPDAPVRFCERLDIGDARHCGVGPRS